ncbi:MAG: choice-of-anchor B family protein [Candidatus Eiseniibacteriota bacterium]
MRPIRLLALVLPAAVLLVTAPAGGQTFQNVILRSNLDEHTGYSDVWGYTAPNGAEYALLGTWNGVAVINVSDPSQPYQTGFVPGANSLWRQVKTYQHWAYVTNESSGGLGIIDLSDPENPVQRAPYTGFARAHNLFIDETTARCYIVGSNLGVGGIRILSLADPEHPVEVGSWEVLYVHDVMVRADRAYCSAIYAAQLIMLNVANPAAIPAPLGTISNYISAFTHSAWPTDDNQYVMTTDEVTGASVRMWDVSNLPASSQTDAYRPNPSGSPHNVFIDGDLAFVSHYTAGVRVLDVTNPHAMQEMGWYDTYPATNGAGFEGCWGVFPYFGTNPDLFVASDIQTGLWVFEYRGPVGTVTGQITQAGDPTVKVAGAQVAVTETGTTVFSDGVGVYSLLEPGGQRTLSVSAFGYDSLTVPVNIVAGSTLTLDLALDALPSGSISGSVVDAWTALPIPGATVEILDTPLAVAADPAGGYVHSAIPAGTFTVQASAFGYDRLRAQVAMTVGAQVGLDFPLPPAAVAETFEGASPGWSVSGSASTGMWERGDPQGTAEGIELVQPENDHTATGSRAWVTGLLAGSALGHYDVDAGETVLSSPVLDLTALAEPRLGYRRWFSTGLGNPTTDFFTVEVSSDGGASWTVIENTDQRRAEWWLVDVALDALIVPTAEVVFRFTARDTAAGSITEAAIDDLTVYDTSSFTGTSAPLGGLGPGVRLSAAFPNPVRGGEETALALGLSVPSRIEARIYDVAGRYVATLASGPMPAGPHRLVWDGRGTRGGAVAAGVYFVRLESEAGKESRKVVILR